MGANGPPSEGVEYRLGSSIIKTAFPKNKSSWQPARPSLSEGPGPGAAPGCRRRAGGSLRCQPERRRPAGACASAGVGPVPVAGGHWHSALCCTTEGRRGIRTLDETQG